MYFLQNGQLTFKKTLQFAVIVRKEKKAACFYLIYIAGYPERQCICVCSVFFLTVHVSCHYISVGLSFSGRQVVRKFAHGKFAHETIRQFFLIIILVYQFVN